MFDINEFLKGTSAAGTVPGFQDAIFKSGGVYAPSGGDMHIDAALTQISLAIMQGAENFVARRAFRSVPVQKQNDLYWTYPRGAFNRNQMKKRAPGTQSVGMNYDVATASYRCDVYAGHIPITDQDRDNADSAFNLDRDATDFLTLKSMILEEVDWSDKFFGGTGFNAAPGGVWTYVADGAATRSTAANLDFTDAANNQVVFWSSASSTPIEDVRLAMQTVQRRTGFRPNAMVMGRPVFDTLVDHPDIIGRLDAGQTPGGPAVSTKQNLAALFQVDEILVMEAVVNAAALGLPDAHDFIGGNNALLVYRPPSAGLKTPAAGYTFLWSGFRGANSGGMRIKNMRDEKIESDIIEAQSAFAHELVASELGFYFNGIVE